MPALALSRIVSRIRTFRLVTEDYQANLRFNAT
jgi:hypothetical protein